MFCFVPIKALTKIFVAEAISDPQKLSLGLQLGSLHAKFKCAVASNLLWQWWKANSISFLLPLKDVVRFKLGRTY